MTHHVIRVEPDGTRVYSNYTRYKPMADKDRTNKVNKPDHPRAVRFHGDWFIMPLFLSDPERTMPETRPDEETLEHRALCKCDVCRRPASAEVWRKARRRRRVEA
jgi:hypothetical protein